MAEPLNLAFLGCGFITRVHSRQLKPLRREFTCSYASRDPEKAAAYCREFGGRTSYRGYESAIVDPMVDAVVIAVPPRFHRELALAALANGKHVLVEKPAFPELDDYRAVQDARNRTRRTVLVGENDHYKPLAVTLRSLLTDGAIGDLVFACFTTIVKRLKTADDWRNDEYLAGGDAFFEEGIHWLHFANSLGPTISSIHGYRPLPSRSGPDTRVKSMMVAFQYAEGAVGSLLYSREIPSLFKGLRLSKLFGRRGIVTFESNGVFVIARGTGLPRVILPGFRDIRGYKAMYRDFAASIRNHRQPEMSIERAAQDHALMERVYESLVPDHSSRIAQP